MSKGEDAKRTFQLGHFDDVSGDLLDSAIPGTSLDELLAFADSGNQPEISAGPSLPTRGWRMIEEHSGLSQSSNQAWVAPGNNGEWHQLNLVTLRRDGSRRVRSAPATFRPQPSRAERRAPLVLEWADNNFELSIDLARHNRFVLNLTNMGPTTWVNVAQDKASLDLHYPGRTPGFTEMVVGNELGDIQSSESVQLEGRLVEAPPVGVIEITAELVDLKLPTNTPMRLSVIE